MRYIVCATVELFWSNRTESHLCT